MNKTKYPNISQLKFKNKTVSVLFMVNTVTNSVAVFLVRTLHAFKMTSCVTLLLYYKVVFLDFCIEYKHNNEMTFSQP